MSNSSFRFKQFVVSHEKSGMKVGTDGVLIGAWANVDNCKTLLDVGTGSGLIALMMTQRNVYAEITAIDIYDDVVDEARENVQNSLFKDRISVLKTSFQDFASATTQRFDGIVSNPPFFANGLLSPNSVRAEARHARSLTTAEIFKSGKLLLSEGGRLSFIFPFSEREKIMWEAAMEGFYLSRETIVYPTSASAAKRILVEFSLHEPQEIISDELLIEIGRHRYSPEFIKLVKDFYLKL